MLTARGLTRRYEDRAVVADACLTVGAGESVALLGPSGCGKTTLLQMLGVLDRPDGGTLMLGDVDPWSLPSSRRAEMRLREVGFVFQSHNLLDHLTACDNVALPAWRLGGAQKPARAAALELLERFGLTHRAHARARELSVGEAQRVAIARALINRPRVVLADEPTGSLDSAAADAVLNALLDGCSEGVALVIVTHDPRVADRVERQHTMRDGRVG